MEIRRYEIKITGIVQGVGFRPFIYSLAKSLCLCGWIRNSGSSVTIEAEGENGVLETFLSRLKGEAPSLSYMKEIKVSGKPVVGYADFSIIESAAA